MSEAFQMKLAAIISIPLLRPKSTISFSSSSVKVGKSIEQPGRFIFFFEVSLKSFKTVTLTESSKHSLTRQLRLPSAINILSPGFTVVGKDL